MGSPQISAGCCLGHGTTGRTSPWSRGAFLTRLDAESTPKPCFYVSG
jgi:hypothetical protein